MVCSDTKLRLQPYFAKNVRHWRNSSVSSLSLGLQETKSYPINFPLAHATRKGKTLPTKRIQKSTPGVTIKHLMWNFVVKRTIFSRTIKLCGTGQFRFTPQAKIVHDNEKLLHDGKCGTCVHNDGSLQVFASKATTSLMMLSYASSR